MKIQQLQYIDKSWKIHMHAEDFDRMQCQLVLVFGESSLITDAAVFNYLERGYPEAHIILSSPSGEIIHTDVFESSVVVTAIPCIENSGSQSNNPDLAILVSCIGNDPELRNRTEEEVCAVNEIFGTATCTTGFYSYGDISPFHTDNGSLHHKTMTITTFTEF